MAPSHAEGQVGSVHCHMDFIEQLMAWPLMPKWTIGGGTIQSHDVFYGPVSEQHSLTPAPPLVIQTDVAR